ARSYTNADFAAGCGRVLVILPLEPTGRIAAVLDRELAELQESAEVLLVRMDERCRRAMGSNPLDPSTRPSTSPPSGNWGPAPLRGECSQCRSVWSSRRLSSAATWGRFRPTLRA